MRFKLTAFDFNASNFTRMNRSHCLFLLFLIVGLNKILAQTPNKLEFRILAASKASADLYALSNEAFTIKPMNIQIPSAFTPNGDGLNDTFGMLAEGIEEMNLVIYNRWGEIVFKSTNANDRWDGTYRGTPAPSGVYGYELAAKNANRESIVKKGNVTLIY